MRPTILLYGATGFSGKLIARELANQLARCDLILGGRDEERVSELAEELEVDYRVLDLTSREDVRDGLRDIKVVLNAAGPFAWTADRLAKVAIEVECSYVDINGEPDVYRRLDDLARHASQRNCTLICGAGFWAAASNILLQKAVEELRQQTPALSEIGAVRIGMSSIEWCSRGSVQTVWRSLREQVLVMRKGVPMDSAGVAMPARLMPWHEPVGKLEHRFDFREPGQVQPDMRVASAVSLVDTLAASFTLAQNDLVADSLASYVEMDGTRRFLYQAGAWMAPIAAIPGFRTLVQQPVEMLGEGPSAKDREESPHHIVLEIEDTYRNPLLKWRWKTPNVYQFTAQLAAEVALRVGAGGIPAGWFTPSRALGGLDFGDAANPAEGVLRGTLLDRGM